MVETICCEIRRRGILGSARILNKFLLLETAVLIRLLSKSPNLITRQVLCDECDSDNIVAPTPPNYYTPVRGAVSTAPNVPNNLP